MLDLQWFDFVGFAGVLLVLGAYAGQQTRKLDGDGVLYSLINLVGAGGILMPVVYAEQMNWSVLFIETAWMAISAYGIWHSVARRFGKTANS
jgi:hypothetical protein